MVTIHGPGDFVGLAALTDASHRLGGATTMTDCTMLRIEKDAIFRLCRNEPKFCALYLNYVLDWAFRIREKLVERHFESAEKCLARILLSLTEVDEEGTKGPVLLDLDQATLAAMVGTTLSRINQFMNKFKKLGYIDYNGALQVDMSELRHFLKG